MNIYGKYDGWQTAQQHIAWQRRERSYIYIIIIYKIYNYNYESVRVNRLPQLLRYGQLKETRYNTKIKNNNLKNNKRPSLLIHIEFQLLTLLNSLLVAVCFPRAVCHPIKADKAWTFSWLLFILLKININITIIYPIENKNMKHDYYKTALKLFCIPIPGKIPSVFVASVICSLNIFIARILRKNTLSQHLHNVDDSLLVFL